MDRALRNARGILQQCLLLGFSKRSALRFATENVDLEVFLRLARKAEGKESELRTLVDRYLARVEKNLLSGRPVPFDPRKRLFG